LRGVQTGCITVALRFNLYNRKAGDARDKRTRFGCQVRLLGGSPVVEASGSELLGVLIGPTAGNACGAGGPGSADRSAGRLSSINRAVSW